MYVKQFRLKILKIIVLNFDLSLSYWFLMIFYIIKNFFNLVNLIFHIEFNLKIYLHME